MKARRDIEPNDPTRSGAPLPTGPGVRLSRNEIEQLCLKAARGAGMSWGLAEEAGFAAAWLALRGLDGPGALLTQLRGAEGRPWSEICPVIEGGNFRAGPGGLLCPISLGAALCDHAHLPDAALQEAALTVGPVSQPVLLLPFLAEFARLQEAPVLMKWSAGTVRIGPDGEIAGDLASLAGTERLEAKLSVAPAPPDAASETAEAPVLAHAILAELNAYALRTTVPASAASRAGAGAAAGDND